MEHLNKYQEKNLSCDKCIQNIKYNCDKCLHLITDLIDECIYIFSNNVDDNTKRNIELMHIFSKYIKRYDIIFYINNLINIYSKDLEILMCAMELIYNGKLIPHNCRYSIEFSICSMCKHLDLYSTESNRDSVMEKYLNTLIDFDNTELTIAKKFELFSNSSIYYLTMIDAQYKFEIIFNYAQEKMMNLFRSICTNNTKFVIQNSEQDEVTLDNILDFDDFLK